jgi:hypothetical protein
MAHIKETSLNEAETLDNTSRNEEKREFLIRKNIKMIFRGMLYIDPHTIPADKEYAWILDDQKVEYGTGNLEDAASKGWVPVTAEERPDLCLIDGNERDRKKSVVRRRELVLHQRDKKFGEYERQVLREYNHSTTDGVEQDDGFMRDPYMPTVVLANKTSRTVE